MISEKMVTLGTKKSVIREIFEYSKKRAAEIGSENVFDFSIGNPNVPAPASVHETIKELLDSKDDYYLFGYTSAQGDADTRAAVAADLNKRFGTAFHADNFYMTCGAAASLRIRSPTCTALTFPPISSISRNLPITSPIPELSINTVFRKSNTTSLTFLSTKISPASSRSRSATK